LGVGRRDTDERRVVEDTHMHPRTERALLAL
jgi:hypothetical protein